MPRRTPTSTTAPAVSDTPADESAPTITPDPVTPDATTPAPAADPVAAIVAVLTADGATPDAVAAVLRTITRNRDAIIGRVSSAVVAHYGADGAAIGAAVGVLTAAATIAATTSAPVPPLTPAAVLSAIAAATVLAPSADIGPRTPLGRFLTAAAAVAPFDGADHAAVLSRFLPTIGVAVSGRGRGSAAASGAPRTRTDRSGGRDAAVLTDVDLIGPNGAHAVTTDQGATYVVTAADGSAVGAFASLTAAANAADGADGASHNGWIAWRAADGRTADAVARGVVVVPQ
jgi:hypothetical protein